MKGLKKKFALVLAFVAVFAMCGSALAATTYYVSSTNGNNSNEGTSQEKALETIQAAVIKAASGDTIEILEGTYTVDNDSLIELRVPVTLKGAGADKTIITASNFGDAAGTKQMFILLGELAGTTISDIGFKCKAAEGAADVAMIFIRGTGEQGNEIIIENCAFTGEQAIAVLTAWGNNTDAEAQHVILRNNTVENVKHGFFLNTVTDIEITGNTITNTLQNGININNGAISNNITISNNTLTNISTTTATDLPEGEDVGININKAEDGNTPTFTVTDNTINMAGGKQDKALNKVVAATQGAQVVTPDGSNVYFSTLTEAVQSGKTVAGSEVTLLSEPTEEEKAMEVPDSITITNADKYKYEPNYVAATQTHSGGGGSGGCSAGFGALALLAAVPLLFRRKK